MEAMKIVVLVGDGMGDYPVASLGNRTPLQAAEATAMRHIAAAGRLYNVITVPEGLPPGSDVCNMGLLGYDARENYTGRAPIEAAGAAIPMDPEDVAYRCNLVTIQDGRMLDYSAGHITTEEGCALVHDVGQSIAGEGQRFYPGVSYRHLLIWRHGPEEMITQPPHEISDRLIAPHLPAGSRQSEVRDLMERSIEPLSGHPVNRARRANGHHPATQFWLWGQGRAMQLQSFKERYGLTGGVVTAVDLVRGLGRLAGLETPFVEGATGFIDTNYAGKVAAAIDLLKRHNFAYVHIEAPDECGHLGDAALKTRAITDFDKKVVGPMWRYLEASGEPYRLILAMDHRTPVSKKGHTCDPVPLAVLDGPVGTATAEAPFDETSTAHQTTVFSASLMRDLLSQK